MKKIRSLWAALLLAFMMTALTACGSMEDTQTTAQQTREETRSSTSKADEGGIIDDVMDDMEDGVEDLKEKADHMTRQTEE